MKFIFNSNFYHNMTFMSLKRISCRHMSNVTLYICCSLSPSSWLNVLYLHYIMQSTSQQLAECLIFTLYIAVNLPAVDWIYYIYIICCSQALSIWLNALYLHCMLQSSPKQLAECVDLLLQLNEPAEELCDEFLAQWVHI